MTLTDNDSIRANETLSVFFHGILGPLTGVEQASSGILNAFAGTSFVVEQVNIPTFSDIFPPDVVGHFKDYDGAGHPLPGRNMTVFEFRNFFLNHMGSVSGIYEVGINKINQGSEKPSFFGIGSISLWSVGILLALVLVFLLVWKLA